MSTSSVPTTVTDRAAAAYARLGLRPAAPVNPTPRRDRVEPVAPSAPPPDVAADGDPNVDLGPLPPGYLEPNWLRLVEESMLCPLHCDGGVILRGPASSGKSCAVNAVIRKLRAAGHRVVYFTTQGFKGYNIDDARGSIQIAHGSTTFIPGPITAAVVWSSLHRDDLVVLHIEEANNVHAGVWAWLHNLIDGSGTPITLPTGESAIPTPGRLKAVLCLNAGYAGTMDLNEALVSRLRVIDVDYLPPDKEAASINAATGLDIGSCHRLASLAGEIRKRWDEFRFDLGTRVLIRMAYLRTRGYGWIDAFEAEIKPALGPPNSHQGRQYEALRQIAMATVQIGTWP